MTDSEFLVRSITEADVAPTADIDSAAFGFDTPEDYFAELVRPLWDLDRFIGAFDPSLDGEQIGSAGAYERSMTFPGGQVHPVAAVTWVGVRPGQHRRGVLTAMMRHQIDDLHTRGAEPVAILTASEAAIYGRFGYGLAVDRMRMEAVSGTAFRPGVAVEPVRQIPREEALPRIRDLYERAAAVTAGHLDRNDAVWNWLYSDHAEHKDGATVLRFALHQDGYASYRLKSEWDDRGPNGTLMIQELCALTPIAHASLWRHVLDHALMRTVVHRRAGADDPLRDLVLDLRTLRMPVTDHVWLRLVDLDRAIGQRSYRISASVTVEVTDSFCPWNAGTWRLDLDTDGGIATRTEAPAEISLDTTDLATVFLGGATLPRLVAAGRITGDPSAIESLAVAMSTPRPPWCPEGF